MHEKRERTNERIALDCNWTARWPFSAAALARAPQAPGRLFRSACAPLEARPDHGRSPACGRSQHALAGGGGWERPRKTSGNGAWVLTSAPGLAPPRWRRETLLCCPRRLPTSEDAVDRVSNGSDDVALPSGPRACPLALGSGLDAMTW